MKRFLSIFLSLVMISSALSSSVFAAEAQGYGSDNSQILYVDDYMEFYENQDYYMDLVDNQHYVLVIDVPDEYLEMEKTRIAGGAEVNALTEGPTTRGTSVPTRAWNVNLYKLLLCWSKCVQDVRTKHIKCRSSRCICIRVL